MNNTHLINQDQFTNIWDKNMTIPIPAMDIVIFTVYKNELCLVLLKSKSEQNTYVLPGGILAKGFSLEENFDNILERKTGITGVYKEQLYTFGNPTRDNRGHVISISYYALIGMDNFYQKIDFTKVAIVKFSELTKTNLGFTKENIGSDHFDIILYAKQRLKWKLEYTNIAKDLLPKEFRISQLREIYEIILGEEVDKRNFRKKIFKLGILKETGNLDKSTKRPSKLYSFIDEELKIYSIL